MVSSWLNRLCRFPSLMIGMNLFLCFCVQVHFSYSADRHKKLQFELLSKKILQEGEAYDFRGTIRENDDLDDVILYFRVRGEAKFAAVAMRLFRGVRYRVTLPASRIQQPGLEWYIVGVDVHKKKIKLIGSPLSPRFFPVQQDMPETKPEPLKKGFSFSTDETIFSASRREQRIQGAPGVVTVVTEAEIQAAGFRDVVEMIRYLVGVDVNYNGLAADIGMRGLNPRLSFGDKIVLMVDGHNMSWRQVNRNSLMIGIDMIKRVEVIRGPGSTLWGANALSGVINIITKTHQDLKGFAGTMGGSPLSRSYFISLQGGHEVLDGLTFRGSFSLFRNELSPLYAPIREFLSRGIHYTPSGHVESNQYFYAHLTWKGLGLSLYQNHFDATLPTATFSVVGGSNTRLFAERYIAKLSWVSLLGDWGTLLLWGSYDLYQSGRGTGYEANSFSRASSRSTLDGRSSHFGLFEVDPANLRTPKFKGYFPLCEMAQMSSIPTSTQLPCILIEQQESGRVCRLVQSPQQSTKTLGIYPVPSTGAPTTPKFCLPSYNNGRYFRGLRFVDHRLSAGAQLSVELSSALYFTAGLDFELLYWLQLHSPEIWESLRLETPEYSNYHFSTFLQANYSPVSFLDITMGMRLDLDQLYGLVMTPRAAVIVSPGLGLFFKFLYGNAFKPPALVDLYYSRKNETYGNPKIEPESVHTLEFQFGWSELQGLGFSLGGFFSYFDRLIVYKKKLKDEPLEGIKGIGDDIRRKSFPDALLPDGSKDYDQRGNVSGLRTYGVEAEVRFFVLKGLNVRAGAGLYFGDSAFSEEAFSTNPLDFAARWMATLQASYRYQFFQVSAGALFVGEKRIPRREFTMVGFFPEKDVDQQRSSVPSCQTFDPRTQQLNCRVPSWEAEHDPTIMAPGYIQTYATLQFLELLGHLDIVLRVRNFLNMEIYDANDEFLSPQQKLDLMAWIRLRY